MPRTGGTPARERTRPKNARVSEPGKLPVQEAGPGEPATKTPMPASVRARKGIKGAPSSSPPVRAYMPEELVAFEVCPRAAYYMYVRKIPGAEENTATRMLKAVRLLGTGLVDLGRLRPPTDREVSDAVQTAGVKLSIEEVARVKRQATVFLKAYAPTPGCVPVTGGTWCNGAFTAHPDLVETDHDGRPVRVVLIAAGDHGAPQQVPGALLTAAVVGRAENAAGITVAVVNTRAALRDAVGLAVLTRGDIDRLLQEAEETGKAFATAEAHAREGRGDAAFAARTGAACTRCGYAAQCIGFPGGAAAAVTREELVATLGELLRFERGIGLVKNAQKPVVAVTGPVEVRGEWWYIARSTSYTADVRSVAELLQAADRDPFEHLAVSSPTLKELMADEDDDLARAVANLAKPRVMETFRHAGGPPRENGDGEEE